MSINPSRFEDVVSIAATSFYLRAGQDDAAMFRLIRLAPAEIVEPALTRALQRVFDVFANPPSDFEAEAAIERLVRHGAKVTPAHLESAPTPSVRAILEAGVLRQAARSIPATTAKFSRKPL